MATIPTMHTFATGEVATASNINNNTVGAFAFLSAVPLCCLRQTITQSIPTGGTAGTGLLWDTEDIDSDNGHSTVTNTSRYVSQTAGWYETAGAWQAVSGLATRRGGWWYINGSKVNAGQFMYAANSNGSSIANAPVKTVFLNVGDYLELMAFQDTTGALSTDVGAADQPFLTVRWVHT